MPIAAPIDFLATFRERRECFSELLALSHEQLALIDAGDYSQLLTILGRKQRIIGRLEEIHRLHPQLARDWTLFRERLSGGTRAACQQTLADTERILEQLMLLERTGTDRIVQRRQETRIELQTATESAKAHAAYHPPGGAHRLLNVDQ